MALQETDLTQFNDAADYFPDVRSPQELTTTENAQQSLSPIIIIPGFRASKLENRLKDKPRTGGPNCKRNSRKWQKSFYISNKNLRPPKSDCWLDEIRLEYEPGERFAVPPQGVQVRVQSFGSIKSITNADSPIFETYIPKLIERLESYGYTRDVNLFAAPYDFRLTYEQFYGMNVDRLNRLIQESARDAKVTLVCHSLGCPNIRVYLDRQTSEWRQKYIHKLIAVSPNWAGNVATMQQLISGSTIDLGEISEDKKRDLLRTWPAMAFRLPDEIIYGTFGEDFDTQEVEIPVVRTPEKHYGLHDIGELLTDLELEHQRDWFERIHPLIGTHTKPTDDISIVCLHGRNVSTVRTLDFKSQDQFPEGQFEVEYGDGDGSVNLASLSLCNHWAKHEPTRIRNIPVDNESHNGMLNSRALYDVLEEELVVE